MVKQWSCLILNYTLVIWPGKQYLFNSSSSRTAKAIQILFGTTVAAMGAALFALIDDIGTAQEFSVNYTVIFYGIELITTSEIDHLLL